MGNIGSKKKPMRHGQPPQYPSMNMLETSHAANIDNKTTDSEGVARIYSALTYRNLLSDRPMGLFPPTSNDSTTALAPSPAVSYQPYSPAPVRPEYHQQQQHKESSFTHFTPPKRTNEASSPPAAEQTGQQQQQQQQQRAMIVAPVSPAFAQYRGPTYFCNGVAFPQDADNQPPPLVIPGQFPSS